jgi:hypothetical protein
MKPRVAVSSQRRPDAPAIYALCRSERATLRYADGHRPGVTDEHVCEECGESFDSEAALRHHVREVGIVE